MIISVASGKGGTGKTTVAVALALSLPHVQFLDCDVEEPNAHLFLKPQIKEKKRAAILLPSVEEEKCTYCGRCRDVCAYNAIAVVAPNEERKGGVLVFGHLCHGCGACRIFCPQGAIQEVPREIGVIETGTVPDSDMVFVHGRLDPGEMMSPPLIRQVKEYIEPGKTVIIDAPPGTSCPVVAAVRDSDFCILVTEPTPFGLHDFSLAVALLKKCGIPCGAVINRCDMGDAGVEEMCRKENIPVLLRLPFDRAIAQGYARGVPLICINPSYRRDVEGLAARLRQETAGRPRKETAAYLRQRSITP